MQFQRSLLVEHGWTGAHCTSQCGGCIRYPPRHLFGGFLCKHRSSRLTLKKSEIGGSGKDVKSWEQGKCTSCDFSLVSGCYNWSRIPLHGRDVCRPRELVLPALPWPSVSTTSKSLLAELSHLRTGWRGSVCCFCSLPLARLFLCLSQVPSGWSNAAHSGLASLPAPI